MRPMLLLCAYGLRPALSFAIGAARRGSVALRSTLVEGELGTESYKNYYTSEGSKKSYWHDIPLSPDGAAEGVYNMVTEIPKMGKAKMEVATKDESNPIIQDTKKGQLRFYHGPIFWNYGCLPMTWENPNEEHPELKCFGDNDPIDVVEIGAAPLEEGAKRPNLLRDQDGDAGSVTPVKALGVLAMIDDGELDWKACLPLCLTIICFCQVIAISESDPLATELNDIADVEAKCPGVVSGIREWFRWYKTPDDKPLNAFGFDEACLPKAKAIEVISETHAAWQGLREGNIDAGKLWTGV